MPKMSTTRELKKLNSKLDGTAWKVPKESKSVRTKELKKLSSALDGPAWEVETEVSKVPKVEVPKVPKVVGSRELKKLDSTLNGLVWERDGLLRPRIQVRQGSCSCLHFSVKITFPIKAK